MRAGQFEYLIAQDGSDHSKFFAKSGLFVWTIDRDRFRRWRRRAAAEVQLSKLRDANPGARIVERPL